MVFALDPVSLEIILRLVLATILGAVVGIEREMTRRPAGLRTHMLVSLGSALFTTLSIFYFQIDPARIAAAIVTGIGFIGAGSVIASRGEVHGITTAASLWTVAGVGLAAGVGAYMIAAVVAILVFVILQVKKFEKKIKVKR